MASVTSAGSMEPLSQHENHNDQLDADIASVRAEIQALTRRKHFLTASLASSTVVQSRFDLIGSSRHENESQQHSTSDQVSVRQQAQHNQTNVYRLACGVTSFPFTNPNPDASSRPLLGIRFDIPSRIGRFDRAPYYIFLKRIESSLESTEANQDQHLQIHHHTIPALVPIQDYEARYLPAPSPSGSRLQLAATMITKAAPGRPKSQSKSKPTATENSQGLFPPSSPINPSRSHNSSSDNDDGDEDTNNRQTTSTTPPSSLSPARPTTTTTATLPPSSQPHPHSNQDLHALVSAVRRDLTSWILRTEALSLLAEQLGLDQSDDTTTDDENDNNNNNTQSAHSSYSLQTLQQTALDARFCRLVWHDGTVGRLRLTDDGYIDRAVVIGVAGASTPNDNGGDGVMGRMKDLERLLRTSKSGVRLKILDLPERLAEVEKRLRWSKVSALQQSSDSDEVARESVDDGSDDDIDEDDDESISVSDE